ncbi:mitochondrial distribution and morphology [Tilletia horrida]|nr:mitochondrial distribution and morphology [Tilletia horrida]
MNNLDLLAERQCAPIFRAYESRNLARAIAEADKVLKKQPALHLAKALKALAAAQLRKSREANALCDQLVALKIIFTPAVALPLSHALTALERDDDLLEMLEATSKAHPEAEDIADQCFSALIKAKLYQRAQQTAQRMHKSFKKDLYFWWSIQAYELLASRQPSAQGAALALPLCERMINQHLKSKPLTGKSDELAHLYITILHKLGKDKEALEILSPASEVGAQLCKRSLALELMRRELWCATGAWEQVREEALAKLRAGETDWAYVYALCQASAKLDAAANSGPPSPTLLKEARRFLQERLGSDRFTRAGSLATLETFAQQKLLTKDGALPSETRALVTTAIEAHLDAFGNKACGAGDVMPYLLGLLSDIELEAIKKELVGQFETFSGSYNSEDELARHMTSIRLLQAVEARKQAPPSFPAKVLAERYTAGLLVGAHLPETEGQPADEVGIMAAQKLLSEAASEDLPAIVEATIFLLYACQKSKKGYRLRVFLCRLLLQLGLFTRASTHWDHLKTAFVQHDTLGHLLLDHGSIFGQVGGVDAAEVTERLRQARTIYDSNYKDTNEMIRVAFQNGTFSKIEEVVDFGERIDRSFSRQLFRLQHAKLALVERDGSAQPGAQSALAIIGEHVQAVLASVREGALCDQRDFTVLPGAHDAQPHFRPDAHALLGSMTTEADILAEAGTLAIAGGVTLSDAELEALRTYEGESKAVLNIALILQGVEQGKKTATDLEEALDAFVSDRKTVLGQVQLPWRLLQQMDQVAQVVSILKLAIHRAKASKATYASDLEKTLSSLRSRLGGVAESLQSAQSRIGDLLQQARERCLRAEEGTVLSAVLAKTAGAGAGAGALVDSFIEDVVERVEQTLVDAVREFKKSVLSQK